MTTAPIRCAGCQRLFEPKRSDALTCSVRCRVSVWRRRHDTTVSVSTAVDTPPAREAPPSREELDGWRRVPGGYVIPPADPRNTLFIDPDALRRL